MCTYFQLSKPVYAWFRAPKRVLAPMDVRYQAGKAAHLDLVQEATDPAWSWLARRHPHEAQRLRVADEPFLRWQLETFSLRAIVCNGRTAYECVHMLVGAGDVRSGSLDRVRWYVATGSIGGRRLGVAGWNLTLNRSGLDAEEQQRLGSILAETLQQAGIRW